MASAPARPASASSGAVSSPQTVAIACLLWNPIGQHDTATIAAAPRRACAGIDRRNTPIYIVYILLWIDTLVEELDARSARRTHPSPTHARESGAHRPERGHRGRCVSPWSAHPDRAAR